MQPAQERIWIGNRIIAAGFLVVLLLLAGVIAIGLRHASETDMRMRSVVENNNVKTRLANNLQTALHERALSMHAASVQTDPFDKDAEIQRFHAFGATYVEARQHLQQLPLTREEAALLERIRVLARESQPEVQAVVEMSTNGDQAAMFQQIHERAMPRQRAIAAQVEQLIRIRQQRTDMAMRDAEASHQQARNSMLLLSLFALLMGGAVALFVHFKVAGQARALARQALYDPLTGLPNRVLLQDRIGCSIALSRRAQRSFALVLIDLDQFKRINDTLGHEVGDEVLREVGQRLRDTVRSDDTVARMSGDEFVLLLQGFGEEDVPGFAAKLFAALEAPFIRENQDIDISASIGFSIFPTHAEDPVTLLRYADIAMYAAKRSGKGYAVYAADQEQLQKTDLSLKGELRTAIQTDQLCLHYQPKANHLDNRITGLEALLRWNHPQRGLLLPDLFIPAAEETGLIKPLTHWVLKTALTQLARLHQLGYPLTMAVNLSALNLRDASLPENISDLLADSGVAASYLTLEITETAVMSRPDASLAILTRLAQMGITLTIDDFGTGYSSLSYLQRLPVSEVKIDKSFVMYMQQDDTCNTIVRSTIDLAHNLGLKVVAEGAESKQAWDALAALGCDYSQGYYLSRPLDSGKLIEWLELTAYARSRYCESV